MMPQLAFAPLVPLWLIAIPAGIALALLVYALIRRARGALLRALPLAALVLALLGPSLAREESLALPDVAVVLVDESASQSVGERQRQTAQAVAALRDRFTRLDGVELRVEPVRPTPGRDEGTRLFDALDRVLADVPRNRLAGVIAVTDGLAHDVPQAAELGAPFHALLTGRPGERDRRLIVENAPAFGIVNQSVPVTLRVDDPGARGPVGVTVRIDGGEPMALRLPPNQPQPLQLALTHAGPTVIEIEAEAGPDELSTANNRAALVVNGVRDRLRVLLVSGEPHQGERTWRNLLKADPSVDLVHFTILRPPEKDDATPIRELALITFPVRELFEEKIGDFDLVIFDRFKRRGGLPFPYFGNVADYVRDGGALLVAAGPEFGSEGSLFQTPLEEILPATPTGQVLDTPFLPAVTDVGRRHPVTSGLPGGQAEPPAWGRWLRQIAATPRAGEVVMTGAGGQPLLILQRVGEGRVAELLSDTVWLWSRGYEGGGPQGELLRRLAHWLMKEPQLDELQLRAEVLDGQLRVERRSLEPGDVEVEVTLPDQNRVELKLTDQGDGRALGRLGAEQEGLYRVSDGERVALAASGALNPIEMTELPATAARLAPVAKATGGAVRWLAEGGVPDLRRVDAGRDAAGRGWIGLQSNHQRLVTSLDDQPLLPAILLLLLTAGGLALAWWREGR